MLPPSPILDAEQLLATSIRTALAPLVDGQVARFNGRPRVYWQLAEQQCPLPYVVAQPQGDIVLAGRVGAADATALVTVRALASDGATARGLLAAVAPGMAQLAAAGYDLTARYVRSPSIPPTPAGVCQAAHMYRVTIARR